MKRVFTIRHERPARKRPVIRKFIDNDVRVSSDRQLIGYVAHKVFTDSERGGNGSTYSLREEREDGTVRTIAANKVAGRIIV